MTAKKKSSLGPMLRAYDQDALAEILLADERDFGQRFGMHTQRTEPKWKMYESCGPAEDYYHFRDNGSSVLAVAHLDTVVRPAARRAHFRNTGQGPAVVSGCLDDRLGAYVILDLLPKLGITTDVLLTVGEESGCSTAEQFTPPKGYDWVIEFDRGSSTDVVMYQYEDDETSLLVEDAGADVGFGSFSDIAYLEHLGIKCFNWGVGYGGNYHSEQGYAFLFDTFRMVGKYLTFHEQNAGTRLEHKPEPKYPYGKSYSVSFDCEFCGTKDSVDESWYCGYCGICQDCGKYGTEVAEQWQDPDVDVCMCYVPARTGS